MHRKRALQMDFREGFYAIVGDTTSAGADQVRQLNAQMLEAAFPDDEEMRKKLLPGYNPGCKRIIISDDYYPTLALSHVDLITDGITGITSTGISTSNNETQNYDIIILATGFETLDFIILMIEAQSSYIAALINPILAARKVGKKLSIRPKEARMEEFNEKLQTELANSAFADPNCQSWYKTDEGLITNNWSRNVVEYQEMVEKVKWDDYEIEGDGKEVLRQKKEVKIGRVREETVVGDGTLKVLGMGSLIAVLAVGWWSKGGGRLISGLRV
jgi:hypothetical protein